MGLECGNLKAGSRDYPAAKEVPAGSGKGETANSRIEKTTSPVLFNSDIAVDNRILPLPAGPGYSRTLKTLRFIEQSNHLRIPNDIIVSRAARILRHG